jgi:hypothetical protein
LLYTGSYNYGAWSIWVVYSIHIPSHPLALLCFRRIPFSLSRIFDTLVVVVVVVVVVVDVVIDITL